MGTSKKGLESMNSDAEAEQMMGSVWDFINKQTETHDPLMVAAMMVTQALTLYKTLLSESEYETMLDRIYETRDQVQRIKLPELQ
jgi:hypothetical protein